MQLYVATDGGGSDPSGPEPVSWPLPGPSDAGGWTPGEVVEGSLELCMPAALLMRLHESIHLAEVLEPADEASPVAGGDGAPADGAGVVPAPGVVRARRARLVAPALWGGFVAAAFALDCAEHVLGEAADVTLPDGTALAAALAQVREWLDSAEQQAQGGPLHKLRDLALGWRLRRQGRHIGDAAFDAWVAATGADVEALEDPAWNAVAAARDAALAAVEAVQHAVFPHLSEFEAHRYEAAERRVHAPIPPAHEHPPSSWVPYWVAAGDATERARQAAAAAGGDDAAKAELAWQAARLDSLLLSRD